MKSALFFSFYLFLVGMGGFLSYHRHLLSVLLMMEMMVLALLLQLGIYLGGFYLGGTLLLMSFFLVCESIVGIGCVVLISRAHGNEFVNSMFLVSC